MTHSPLLIAFNGFKSSGKNTAANVVSQWGAARGLVVGQRAFAGPLKLSAARAMGFPNATNENDAIVLMDALKDVGTITVEIPTLSIMRAFTGREFLKWYGTEAHRDVFWEEFWVDQILPLAAGYPWWAHFSEMVDYNNSIAPDIAVVTDCRFVNEATRVHELGGEVIEIHRPNIDDGDEHLSEQPLPRELVDATIENDSTLEAFEVAVNSWMTDNYHARFVSQLVDE